MPSTGPVSHAAHELAPWPHYEEDEVAAAAEVLRSGKVNYWTGDHGRAFEREYAAATGRAHAVAVANGTLALELGLMALGVREGDEVITTPRTFIASASAAVMRGATPVLADVDRDSGNLDPDAVEAAITPRTRAIVPVHLGGWPAAMDRLMEIGRHHDIPVLEDCAQAHGALYQGRPVGSFGDMAAFSFCQDKIITTSGEGGMLVLDGEDAWRTAWAYKDHGKSYEAVYEREHPPGYRWLHESFGTNWRMTEIQAVVGRLQLGKLEHWVALRNRNADILYAHLGQLDGLRVPRPADDVRHAYYRMYGYVVPEALKSGWTRERIQDELASLGTPVMVGSCSEIYREKAFANASLGPRERLPVARELGDTALMFQVHPRLSEESLHAVGETVAAVVQRATR